MPQAQERDPVDLHVGKQLQELRKKFSINQTQLGDILGVSYQQIQKYEKGYNRLGASGILKLTKSFEIPASYFFDGYSNSLKNEESPTLLAVAEDEILQILSLFMKIRDPHLRQLLVKQAYDFSQ